MDEEQIALLQSIVDSPKTLPDVRLAVTQAIQDSRDLDDLKDEMRVTEERSEL